MDRVSSKFAVFFVHEFGCGSEGAYPVHSVLGYSYFLR